MQVRPANENFETYTRYSGIPNEKQKKGLSNFSGNSKLTLDILEFKMKSKNIFLGTFYK